MATTFFKQTGAKEQQEGACKNIYARFFFLSL